MSMDDLNRHREQDARAGADADAPELSLEQEAIVLCSAYEQIGNMVSHSLISFSESQDDAIHLFKGSPHQQMFFILLVDFLAKTDKKGPLVIEIDLLKALRAISTVPKLPHGGATGLLQHSVDEFVDWLDRKRDVDVWMGNIGRDASIRMTLRHMISLYGNRVKHSGLRTGRVAKTLQQIMIDAGLAVTDDELQPALADIYGWADEHFMPYYQNQLFAFLGNIRSGIDVYARPEFKASFHWPNGYDPIAPHYSYRTPETIRSASGRRSYWDLMNYIRSSRPVQVVAASQYLRGNPHGITDDGT